MEWTLSLTLRSPFMLGGSDVAQADIDARTLLDHDKHAVMPGTMIKGLVRAAMDTLAGLGPELGLAVPDVAELFGVSSPDNSLNEPKRGHLTFSDLRASKAFDPARNTRIRIDATSGTADEGAMLVAELAAPPGQAVCFEGTVNLVGQHNPDVVKRAVKLALETIPSVGQWRHIGFGEVVERKLDRREAAADDLPPGVSAAPAPAGAQHCYAVVAFDGPFIAAATRPDDNSFAGQDIVPGGALKGAMADLLAGTIGAELAALTFHHGNPVDAEWCAAPTPPAGPIALSVAVFDNGRCLDTIAIPSGPVLENGGRPPLPAYQVDWKPKDWDLAGKKFGSDLPKPAREQRTRAEIGRATGAAVDQKLFSQEAVCPYKADPPKGKPRARLFWAFRISGDAAQINALAAAVARQRFSLGKLKTGARVIGWVHAPCPEPVAGCEMVVTLNTPGVLASLERIAKHNGDMHAAYAAYFKALCPHLTLVRFFARQRRIDGYQAIRFPVQGTRYAPWVLTEAGSTFLLSVQPGHDATLEKLARGWLREGLPSDFTVPAGKQDWEANPFPPQNGFGAVRIGAVPSSEDDLTLPKSAYWRVAP